MADKHPTQAIPDDGKKGAFDGTNRAGEAVGRGEGGESGGGSYPNPHTGQSEEAADEGFGSHGGQSVMGYHGDGQLGDKKVDKGGNPNAGARTD